MLTRSALLFAAFLLSGGAAAQEQSPWDQPLLRGVGLCGPIENAYGPYDYRRHADKHAIVERFHFTPQVEALRKGESGPLGGDISYTLRAFPNHPRALHAMARYGQRLGAARVPGATYPVECYFDRAIRFVPDDPQVRALYADFLIRDKRNKDARRQLEAAEKLQLDPQTAYNVALAWTNLGENERALPLAKRAYAGGIGYPGLRDRLQRAGVWK